MDRRAVCGIILTLLLTCMLTLAFNIQPAKGEWTGTLYIRADGSIEPADAPIITYDNVTYTLTDNITSSADGIVVERDNIVIDGAGHTLQGTGEYPYKGVYLSGRSNVTIKNAIITTFSYGIWLNYSSNNSIVGNNVTANNGDGILLRHSLNNSIVGNNVTANNGDGIQLSYSSNNRIVGNGLTNDGLVIWDSYGNSVENNTVNGKPLVYLEGITNYSVGDAGQVVLVRCNRITVKNLNLSRTDVGVQLYKTQNSIITGNNIANNAQGIMLGCSSNNSITGNNIKANDWGIWLEYSSNNRITGNNIKANDQCGILLFEYSLNNRITGNNIKANNWDGIQLVSSSYNNIIVGNNIANNDEGILLWSSSYNRIFHNNFIENTQQVFDFSWVDPSISPSINVWDDGYPSGGNYWSDYAGVDADGDGIGDTPYVIDENNKDRYPLMNAWGTGTPVASFAWSPSVPEVDELVTFDASASMPVGGEFVSYEWDFGDGEYASGMVVTHRYGTAGTFTVTLNLTDSEGLWDIEQKRIEVKAPPLTVSISPTSASILVGQPVTFTSTVSGGYTPYSYQWYLNGSAVPGATADSWTFMSMSVGVYEVYLNVTDSSGNIAISQIATVSVAPQITVSISPMSMAVIVGEPVTFTSTTSGGYPPYAYQWYLNGNPASGATSDTWTFTPTESGIYYVYLKVTDGEGNTAQSETARITVAAVPVGGYSIPIQAPATAKPLSPYLILTAILTIAFTTIKRKTKKKAKM